MIRSLRTARGALLCTLAFGVGCHRRHAEHVPPAMPLAAPDSLRGIVSVTGSSLEQRFVLRSGERAVYLRASPADSAALQRVAGVHVLVRGTANATVFGVSDFTVVNVDAAPALDGVLRTDGGQLVIDTRTGRVVLGNPPVALRSLVGARVWITGPAATGPLVYGVITPR